MINKATIKVYLDTQDYARLYRDDINVDLQYVRNTLMKYRENSQVEFVLSEIVLIELLQEYTPQFYADRHARAKFVSDLCGDNCLQFVLIADGFPEKALNNEHEKRLSDPENYRIWFDFYSRPNNSNYTYTVLSERLSETIKEIRSFQEQNSKSSVRLKKSLRGCYRIIDKAKRINKKTPELTAILDSHAQKFSELKAQIPVSFYRKIEEIIGEAKRNSSESPDLLQEIFDIFIRSYLGDRKFKPSDSNDLVHSFYINKVDLWRGDQAFCGLLLSSGFSQKEKIVSSLIDLPDRIAQLLKQQQSADSENEY